MRLFAFLITTLAASMALAQPAGPLKACGDWMTVISALGMDSSRSFNWDGNNRGGQYSYIDIEKRLTDANTSITSFVETCTVSDDNGTTDITPTYCPEGSTCVVASSGAATFASPGSLKWATEFRMGGYPDLECVYSVGSGSGAAADLLTVRIRLCAE